MDKKAARLRRAAKSRAMIRNAGIERLTVYRTPRHMYAQVTSSDGANVLACCSTLEKSVKTKLTSTSNIDAAGTIGRLVAERALAAGVTKVAFDRSGFKYHGRVKALAEAARSAGLQF